jgi:transcription elongation factor GreA-like protein
MERYVEKIKEQKMDKFYRKIIEPLLRFESKELREVAKLLKEVKPDNDDNLFHNCRIATANTLTRLASTYEFVDWVFSDKLKRELEDHFGEEIE